MVAQTSSEGRPGLRSGAAACGMGKPVCLLCLHCFIKRKHSTFPFYRLSRDPQSLGDTERLRLIRGESATTAPMMKVTSEPTRVGFQQPSVSRWPSRSGKTKSSIFSGPGQEIPAALQIKMTRRSRLPRAFLHNGGRRSPRPGRTPNATRVENSRWSGERRHPSTRSSDAFQLNLHRPLARSRV